MMCSGRSGRAVGHGGEVAVGGARAIIGRCGDNVATTPRLWPVGGAKTLHFYSSVACRGEHLPQKMVYGFHY